MAQLVARRTNNPKVVGSFLLQCFSHLSGNREVKLSAVAGHHSFFRAVRSWSLRLSALMDSDLALVNGNSGR